MPVAPISGAVSEDEAYVAGGWASSSPAFAISRGTRAATPSTPSLRSTLPHHAIFPSRSRVQVGWASRRSPPPKPPPPAGAIQRRVKRRTSCCLSAAGIRFLGVLFPPRDSASLTVGLPPHPPGVVDLTGFPRSTRARYGRVGCHLYPGGDGVHTTVEASSVAVCRFSTACPSSSPPPRPDPGSCRNEASTMVHSIHPFGLPLTCSTQSERAPLGFPPGFTPGHYWPRTPGRGPVTNTDQESRPRHQARTSNRRTHSQRATSRRNAQRQKSAFDREFSVAIGGSRCPRREAGDRPATR